MNKEQKSIISSLIIFGATNIYNLPLSKVRNNQISVGLLFSYPSDKKYIDYSMWAYPDGIKIYDQNFNIINDNQPQFSFLPINNKTKNPPDTLHSFVLTDYSLNRTYSTCLIWHEKGFIENDQTFNTSTKLQHPYSKTIPKCTLQELTQNPLLLEAAIMMVYIPKALIISSFYPCFQFQRKLLMFYYNYVILNSNTSLSIQCSQLESFQNLINSYGFPKAEAIFDHIPKNPQSETKPIVFRNRQNKVPIIIKQPTQRKLISRNSLQSFYSSMVFLPTYSSTPTLFVENQLTITYFPTIKQHPLSPPDINIIHAFQLFGIENILTLWKSALLERQILVFCSDPYLIIELFQTLIYLIEPMAWQNIYIPFLPFHLYHHVDAIGGYMIGMSRIHMNYIIEHFNLRNKCLVNIDQMIIVEQGNQNNIHLPESIKAYMIQKISAILIKTNIKNNNSFYSLTSSTNEQTVNYVNILEQKIILEIKIIFLNTIIYLFNNYLPYSKWNEQSGVEIDTQKYLLIFLKDAKKQQQNDRIEWSKFMMAMSKTMVFIRLVEYHLKKMKTLQWNQTNIKQFYIYCYNIIQTEKIKEKKQQLLLWNINEPFPHQSYLLYSLNQTIKQLSKLTTIHLQHYAIKYIKYIQFTKPQKIIKKTINKKHRSLWQILTFTKLVSHHHQINRKDKLNQQNCFKIKEIIDLRNIFQWLKQSNYSSPLQSNKNIEQQEENKDNNIFLEEKMVETENIVEEIQK